MTPKIAFLFRYNAWYYDPPLFELVYAESEEKAKEILLKEIGNYNFYLATKGL